MKKMFTRAIKAFVVFSAVPSSLDTAAAISQKPECQFDALRGQLYSLDEQQSDYVPSCSLTGENGYRTDLKLESIHAHWGDATDSTILFSLSIRYEGESGSWWCGVGVSYELLTNLV